MNWTQLQAILWLRWRLTRNQWMRGNRLNAVLAILVVIGGVLLTIAGGIGGLALGALALAHARPPTLLAVWDGVLIAFLFFWTLGVITEIQRSESIDIRRLLHLPVSIKGVFVVNYLASHMRLLLVIFVPAMLGLILGLAASQGGYMLLLLPLVLSFVFMISAWTYCLRGWLVALMVNQRRRRAILVGITTVFILLCQAPNLYFNVFLRRSQDHTHRSGPTQSQGQRPPRDGRQKQPFLTPAVLRTHQVIPVLWTARGAFELASGKIGTALWGTLGALCLGGLGLQRAYRGTRRFYQGANQPQKARTKPKAPAATAPKKNLLEKHLPGVPEEAAAMALATFRSMLRAPELKMAFASSFIVMVIFGSILFTRNMKIPSPVVAPFLATGAVAFMFMSLLQVLLNQFGFDREGFRALVLLPSPRKYVLLGKNLAVVPIAVTLGLALLLVLKWMIHIPLGTLAAAGIQFVAACLLTCILGNLVSILAPYRIAAGGMKPTKMPFKTTLLIFAMHLLFPFAMIPLFVPPAMEVLFRFAGWVPWLPVNALLSLLLVAILAVVYPLALTYSGNLLQQREQRILQVVTREVE